MNLEEFKAELVRRFPFRPGINYMAVDENGYVYQYDHKPRAYTDNRCWYSSAGVTKYQCVIYFPPNLRWGGMLICRAETEQPTQPAAPTFEQRHDALMAKLDELIGVLRAVVEAVQPVNDYKGVNEQQ